MSWDALNRAVEEARAAIAAAAPDAQVAAEGEAYVARVVASSLGGAVLGHLFSQDGLSRALPTHGGPNPDYIMRFAPVEPDGEYRLEGRLNGSERIGVGLYSYGPNGAPLPMGYAAFDSANCAPDGSFALDLGPKESAGLQIPPAARVLLVRVLHRDDDGEPARLRLTGGASKRGLALAAGSAEGALGFVARSVLNNVHEYLKWSAAASSLANRLDFAPPELAEAVQGDPDTVYFLGGFHLAEGEWLEVTMPQGLTGYWSLHGYDFWYEHLQTPGVHDRNARPDPDGRIRIGVGPRLPEGASNRIDTLGRNRGAFVCRVIGSAPAVSLRPPATVVRRLDE